MHLVGVPLIYIKWNTISTIFLVQQTDIEIANLNTWEIRCWNHSIKLSWINHSQKKKFTKKDKEGHLAPQQLKAPDQYKAFYQHAFQR